VLVVSQPSPLAFPSVSSEWLVEGLCHFFVDSFSGTVLNIKFSVD
jgi:hypothetical protein